MQRQTRYDPRVEELLRQLRVLFPTLVPRELIYLRNKICNRLRKLNCDIYEVQINTTRNFKGGYGRRFEVEMRGRIVFVRVKCD